MTKKKEDDHSLDLYWHALNFRTAAAEHADEAWKALDKCVDGLRLLSYNDGFDECMETARPLLYEEYQ